MADESGERAPDVFKSLRAGIAGMLHALRAFGRTLGRRALARSRSSSPKREGDSSGFTGQERVEAAKYLPPAPASLASIDGLPDSYGRPGVTLAVVDPYLIYAYWDIDSSRLPPGAKSAVLRLYDASESPTAAPLDVEVDLRSRNWYVHLWNPAKSYYADLGVRTLQNGFISLAVSNRVHTPRAWPVAENHVVEIEPQTRPIEESRAAEVQTRTMAAAAGVAAPAKASEPEPPVAGRFGHQQMRQIVTADRPPEGAPQVETSKQDEVHKGLVSDAAVASEAPVAPRRVDAAHVLQRKLEEIYALRPWRSHADGEASAAPEAGSAAGWADFTSARDAIEPPGPSPLMLPGPVDLTALTERRLYPALPSSMRPVFHRPDSAAG